MRVEHIAFCLCLICGGGWGAAPDAMVARKTGDPFRATVDLSWLFADSDTLSLIFHGDGVGEEASVNYDSIMAWNAAAGGSHAAVTMSGARDYVTLSGQDIVRNEIDIGDDTNLAGTTNQVTVTGDAVGLANPLTAPGPVTAMGDVRAYNGTNGISLVDQFCATPPFTNNHEGAIYRTGGGSWPFDEYGRLVLQGRSSTNAEMGVIIAVPSDTTDGLTRDGVPVPRFMITDRRKTSGSPQYGAGSVIGLKNTTKTFEFDSNGNLWTLGDVTVGDDLNITGDNINITGNATVDLAGPYSGGTLQLGDSDGNDTVDIPYAQINELYLGPNGSYLTFESSGTTFAPYAPSGLPANVKGSSLIAPVHYVVFTAEALLYNGQIAKPSSNYKFVLNDASGKKAFGIAYTSGTAWQTTVASDWPLAVGGRVRVAPAEDVAPTIGQHAFQSATAGYAGFQDDPPGDGTGLGIANAVYAISTINHLTGVNTGTDTITGSTLIAVNQPVIYWNSGGTSIGGLDDGAVYWVKTSNLAQVTLSKTADGATVDLTSGGTDSTQYLMALPEIMLQWE